MNITDVITQAIFNLLNQENGTAQIQRNELAQKIGCAPSQINYVITSRFTPEKGFLVESRRGGGGYIKIKRAQINKQQLIMHIINSLGSEIDEASTRIILENLMYDNVINQSTAKLILSALTDNVLKLLDVKSRNIIRAAILKSMLLNII